MAARSTKRLARLSPPSQMVLPSDGARVVGCLSGFVDSWPPHSWATKVVRMGMSWPWVLHLLLYQSLSSWGRLLKVAQNIVDNLLLEEVVKKAEKSVSHAFTVPTSDSDMLRLVINLSRLNWFVGPRRFCILMVRHLRLAFHQNAWFAAVNLEKLDYSNPSVIMKVLGSPGWSANTTLPIKGVHKANTGDGPTSIDSQCSSVYVPG